MTFLNMKYQNFKNLIILGTEEHTIEQQKYFENLLITFRKQI